MRPSGAALILAAVALVVVTTARGVAATPKEAVVGARAAAGPIHVDGTLDEPAWADAAVITDLAQQAPRPGEPTAFRTEVRILIDRDNVYVGFHCVDPEPRRIATHTLQRDGALDGDGPHIRSTPT